MVLKIAVLWLLIFASVWLHFAAMVLLFLRLKAIWVTIEHTKNLLAIAWLLFRVFNLLVLVHVGDVLLWACFYRWKELFSDFPQAFYFSISAYTTLLTGDVALPQAWRLFGRLEAMVGLLMFGWSSGFIFAVVNRIYVGYMKLSAAETSSFPVRAVSNASGT